MMEFLIKKAAVHEADEVADLIQAVWEQMEHKEWFVADNAEYTSEMMSTGKGIVYKAIEQETGNMAAVFMVTIPGDEEQNLGREIGLELEELKKVAHMESMAILPEYRGNRLMYRMMQSAEKELAKSGYRYLMCTVHPDNRYSKENMLRQNYRVVATKEKYGGYWRDIMLKDLQQEEQ